MAADTMLSGAGIRLEFNHKIRTFTQGKKKRIVGVAGAFNDALNWLEWYGANCTKRPYDRDPYNGKTDIDAVILDEKGRLFIAFSAATVEGEVNEEFVTVGSGGSIALGALANGADVVDALKIAHRYDAGTGPGILVVGL